MSNTLGAYNPVFYAQEALIQLEFALGIASRVHRGYEAERRSANKGDTITIKRPSTFTAQTAPSSAQAIATGTVDLKLDQHYEVKFELPDKEHAYTGMQIVTDHIRPAAYALAKLIDSSVVGMAKTVPHAYVEPSAATAVTVAGITRCRRALVDLGAPVDMPGETFFMVGGQEEADALQIAAFSQWQGAGPTGVETQRRGQLGPKYGFEFFTNQNRQTQAYADITDFAGAGPTAAAGATSLAVTGLGTTEVIKKGSILKFTSGTELGNRYAVTADVTLSGGGGTLVVNPGLRVGCTSGDTFAINDLAAVENNGAAGTGALDNVTNNVNLAFCRGWAALGFAKLPDFNEFGNRLGAEIFSVQDPKTGLALRARIYYDGDNSKMICALDTLFGFKELNADQACRYEVKAA